MEGLIFLLVLFVIGFFLLLILTVVNMNGLRNSLDELNRSVKSLTEKTEKLNGPQAKETASSESQSIPVKEVPSSSKPPQPTAADMSGMLEKAKAKAMDEKKQTAIPVPPPVQPLPEVPLPEVPLPPKAAITPEKTPVQSVVAAQSPFTAKPAVPEKPVKEVVMAKTPVEPPKPHVPSPFELRLIALRNWFIYGNANGKESGESVEKMLATTWLLRSGILVILCTSAFLLKLSIERGLLAPSGRVALSYLCGAALLIAGLHRKLRKDYWSLGQALVGIGLGMFYFSSYAMVNMYHLTSPMVGGAVMVLVTVTAGILADRLVSLPIAMVTMLGGFATPLLLSTGEKNFTGLGAYLLLLSAGVLWLANRRNWQQLTWLAMLFTYGIFGLHYASRFTPADFAVQQTFLVLFFILYSTSVFIHNIRLKLPATPLEILGLLGNSALFFCLSSVATLKTYHNDRLTLAPLTIGLAFYYLCHAVWLKKRNTKEDRNLLLMFCALSGFYLSLTFPVILTEQWLGAAWALQGLMMLWLGYKLESRFLRCCAWLLYILSLGRLALWEFVAYNQLLLDDKQFWNHVISRCVQFIIPVVCLALAAKIIAKNSTEESKPTVMEENGQFLLFPRMDLQSGIFMSLAFIVGFIFMRLELANDMLHIMPSMWLLSVNIVWIAAACLALWLLKRNIPGFWWSLFLLLSAGIFARIVFDFFKPELWDCFRPDFLWSYSIGTILNTVILAIGIWYIGRILPQGNQTEQISDACNLIWPLLLFIHSTRELQNIITNKLPGLTGGGISVLWSIFAFVLVFNGLRKSNRNLRYIGLALFTVVVFKVFLWDMRQLDAIYRVCAFLVFGVLLMCAAFIYLKFWRGKTENVNMTQKQQK